MKRKKNILALILNVLLLMSYTIQVDASSFNVKLTRFDALGNPIDSSTVDFDGESNKKFYANREGSVLLTWTETSNNNFIVFYTSGNSQVPLNASAVPNQYAISNGANLPEGTYTLTVKENIASNPKTSHNITLIIDTTPPLATSGISFADMSNNPIGPVSSLRTFKLNWSAAKDVAPHDGDNVARYEVRFQHTGISSTLLDDEVTGTSFNVSLSSALADQVITFQVFSIDKAGNKNSVPATATYTLNSTIPNSPTTLIVKNTSDDILAGQSGGNFDFISFTASTSSDIVSYEIATRASDTGTFQVIQSGSTAVSYSNIFSGLTFTEGARASIRVVAIDSAGNRSSALTRSFIYDSVAPVFDVRFLNRGETPARYDTVSGITVNSITRTTLEVTNALNDITSYEVIRGSTQIRKEAGNASDLETYLKTLQTNGTYRVIVFDNAMNRSEIQFDVRVEPPSLPTNRTLTVNGEDTSPIAGVNAVITVEFDPSSSVNIAEDNSTYKLFVNGRPVNVNPTAGSNGRVKFEFNTRTAFYGDLVYIYEVQAVDIHGNIARYNIQTGAVIRDRSIPVARVLSTQSFGTSIRAVIELNDFNRVLTAAGAKAELYNGTVLVATLPLTIGTQEYIFTNLRERQTNYNIKIVGSYTLQNAPTVLNAVLNGASDSDKYLIDTLRIEPEVTATIENLVATENSIKFDVLTLKNINQARIFDVFLFEGVGPYTGNPVKSVRVDLIQAESSATNEVEFTGLTSGVNYHIQIREGGYVINTARIVTNLLLPTSDFSVVSVEQNQATVNINVANLSNALAFVFQGNDLVNDEAISLVNGLNRRVITGLLPNTEFTIKILGDYPVFTERQNGSVVSVSVASDLIGEYSFKTAKQVPTGSIPPILIDVIDNEVLFSVLLEDPDNALKRASAVLYEGNVIVNETPIDRGRSNLKFENLKSDTEYILSIHVTYDLDNGEGEISRFGRLVPSALTPSFAIQSFKTIKALPSAEITNVNRTNNTLTIALQPTDPNGAFLAGTIRIFGDQASPLRTETLIRTQFQREILQSFTFTGLSADTVYRIEVEIDYNLLDGRGIRTYKPVNETHRTLANINLDILAIRPTPTQISVDLDLRDFTGQSVLARLFRGDSQVGNAIPVRVNESTIVFDQLDANTSYRLVVDYNNGTQLLASRDVQTRPLTTLATPSATINLGEVTNQRVTISLNLVDEDLTIIQNASVVLCDNDFSECITESRTITQLLAGTEVLLPYERQTITVRLDYDLQTSTGSLELNSRLISLSETPEPEPEPIVEPTVPREPLGINIGIVVASVVGAIAVGFVGVFFYSFRSFYLR